MKTKMFQFSKKGKFLKKIPVRGCPRLLGIDINGWLLVHQYCDYGHTDPRLSVYNSTSLRLYKDLKDKIYRMKIFLDDESNIWVLTENENLMQIIKYTV